MPVRVSCPCGKTVSVPENLQGKRIKCPQCQNPISVPVAAGAVAAGGVGGGMADLLNEVGFDKTRTANSCPSCKTELEPEAVLCVACGYNLETGRIIKTRRIEKDPFGLKANTAPPPTGISRFALPGAALGGGIVLAIVLSLIPAGQYEVMGLDHRQAELVATYAKFVGLGLGLIVALALTRRKK